jgi:hypothetical protein
MTHEELRDLVVSHLPPAMHTRSGAVLGVGVDMIKPSNLYVMGLNPGGDPDTIRTAIIDALAQPSGTSGYTHECWQRNCTEPMGRCQHVDDNGRVIDRALTKHQRNYRAVVGAFGKAPEEVPTANAIFARSASLALLEKQTSHNAAEWWRLCWPVHQAILREVMPVTIVTLGRGEVTSAFGLLRREAGYPDVRQIGESGRRGGKAFDWQIKLGDVTLSTTVIGVPHPSWYAAGPLLLQELATLALSISQA